MQDVYKRQNVEIVTNRKALSTVRNKKKELKDLDNHAWQNDSETSTNVVDALDLSLIHICGRCG